MAVKRKPAHTPAGKHPPVKAPKRARVSAPSPRPRAFVGPGGTETVPSSTPLPVAPQVVTPPVGTQLPKRRTPAAGSAPSVAPKPKKAPPKSAHHATRPKKAPR
jgi:hypothetical protein